MWEYLSKLPNQVFVFVLFVELGVFTLDALGAAGDLLVGTSIWGGFGMLTLRSAAPAIAQWLDTRAKGGSSGNVIYTHRDL